MAGKESAPLLHGCPLILATTENASPFFTRCLASRQDSKLPHVHLEPFQVSCNH